MSLPPHGSGRYRGALLGLACADALGASLEPGARPAPGGELAGGGPLGLSAGEWTGDTATALCLAESLADLRRFDASDQLARYQRWYREAHLTAANRCVGPRDALRGAIERFEQGLTDSDDPGRADVGVLSRVAPVALFFASDPREAIRFSAAAACATGASPVAIDACRYLAALLTGALQGRPLYEILAAEFSPVPGLWDEAPLCPEIRSIAARPVKREPPADAPGAARALGAALEALQTTRDFEEGCLHAVSSAADGAGAIHGQLAGAIHGEAAIPSRWRKRILRRAAVTALAERLHEAASSRVPEAPFAGAYWVEPGGVLAGPYPGPAAIAPLIEAGISFFLDLTEAGENSLASYLPALERASAAIRRAVEHRRVPIRDRNVPSVAEMRSILDAVAAARRRGARAYVHGQGGVGRTGTTIACRLVERGMSADAAIARIAEIRAHGDPGAPPSPETEAQVAFVRAWERQAGAPLGWTDALQEAIAGVVLDHPATYGGVSVFPLLRRDAEDPPAYITLEHALDQRSIMAREVSEAGSVPQIEMINRGPTAVLLLEGEELIGAKQNRIVNLTVLVPPRASRTIPVTCVEQGRWSYTSRDFTASATTVYPTLRGETSRGVSRSLQESGVHSVDQRVVWRDIARMSERLGARSETGALRALFTEHDAAIAGYVASLPAHPDQVGAVFAIHGRIIGFDLFGAPSTLRSALPKLLKGYAVEALAHTGASAPPPGRPSAARLLESAARAAALSYPSIGLGRDLRFTTWAITGSALATRDGVVHASGFWTEEGAGGAAP